MSQPPEPLPELHPALMRLALRLQGRRAAAARQRVTKPCEICGTPMQGVLTTRRYCSGACNSKAHRRRHGQRT